MKSNNAPEKKKPEHERGVRQGVHDAGKDNSSAATLRVDSLPQAEKVRELPLDGEKSVATKHAATQNSSLTSSGDRIQNVPPCGADFPTTVSPD
jgi:hypothetical protein